MPNLGGGGGPKRRELNFDEPEGEGASKPKSKGPVKKGSPAPTPKRRTTPPQQKPKQGQFVFDDEEEDGDEEDEIIQASISKKKNGMDPKLFAPIAGVAIVLVIILFVVFGRKKEPDPVPVTPTEPAVTETEPPSVDPTRPDSVGIQDFTGNTNNTSDSPLSNPDGFVEDIQGLTMRVEYDVTAITNNTVDFVNYTKKRGTWGGGLELYWLDCTYKTDKHYVIQVPFKYYKELDDVGTVPVKMEILQVKQPTGELMYVISCMDLDETTLKTFLNSQKK